MRSKANRRMLVLFPGRPVPEGCQLSMSRPLASMPWDCLADEHSLPFRQPELLARSTVEKGNNWNCALQHKVTYSLPVGGCQPKLSILFR